MEIATGFICAAEADGVEGETFNLGIGREIRIDELATLIRDIVGRDVPVEQEDARMRPAASEVDRLCSSPDRAHEVLGWKPAHDLRTGLALTVEWIRARGPGARVEQFAV